MAQTSSFGNTPQGQSQQRFQDILASITGGGGQMAPQVAQQGYQSALSTQLAMNENQAPFMEQARQSLTQQSGIPQLQNQYADLGKLFELYLADSNLAGKYSNQSNTNPYANAGLIAAGNQGNGQISGEATSAPNPYLAGADALAEGATPTGGGFTVPGLTTQAIGAPVSAAQGLMDLVNQAIGIQEGRVTKKVGDVSTSYQKSLDTLGVLAKVFSDERDRQEKAKEGSAGGIDDFMAELDKLRIQNQGDSPTFQPTEPPPSFKPGDKFPVKSKNTTYRSSGGQWVFNWDFDDWVPAGAEVGD